MDHSRLLEKIRSKKARIGVIGLGYVGLPLAILAAKQGFYVTGFGRSKENVDKLLRGETRVDTTDKEILKNVLASKKFKPQQLSVKELQNQDIIIICVPTPITRAKSPDLTAIKHVAGELSKAKLTNQLIINESTVAPGTTRELFDGLSDYLACSPERIDPGNHDKNVANIAKIVGGKDSHSLALAQLFYKQILSANVVSVPDLETAEMAKMLENTYRAVNIALINEVALLCEKLGIDVLEVIRAASTKWSFQAHFPGIGVGGHCIPVDPYYLVDLSQKKKISMTVVASALQRNSDMPRALFEKVKAVYKKGMSLVVYGITYKKDVADLRESPVLVFCEHLTNASIPFGVFDPLVDKLHLQSLGLNVAKSEHADIFVVGTDHSQLVHDQKIFISSKTIVIDGRNAFAAKTGSRVIGVGRAFL
mgnify:CR=1 FL=1